MQDLDRPHCCGKLVKTPFCPNCGAKQYKQDDPLASSAISNHNEKERSDGSLGVQSRIRASQNWNSPNGARNTTKRSIDGMFGSNGSKPESEKLGMGQKTKIEWCDSTVNPTPCCTDGKPPFTKFFGQSSIFCITPCTEETARTVAGQCYSKPVEVYSPLPQLGHDDDYDE